jgi:hypothetical protein
VKKSQGALQAVEFMESPPAHKRKAPRAGVSLAAKTTTSAKSEVSPEAWPGRAPGWLAPAQAAEAWEAPVREPAVERAANR